MVCRDKGLDMARIFTVDEKGAFQEVASVICNPKLHSVSGTETEVRLNCTAFTRDPMILGLGIEKDDNDLPTSAPQNITQKRLNIFSDDPTERARLMKFGAFLRERKKAGICHFEGNDIYVLPPPVGAELIQCFIMRPKQVIEAKRPSIQRAPFVGPSKGNKSQVSSSSSSTAEPKSSKPMSMLASLTSRASAGVEARVLSQAVKNAKAAQVKNADYLEQDIRMKMEEFEADPSLNEVRLDPMEKDQRYVVHDVVSQYSHLVSASVGDMEDRHVVVYRRGFQPADVEIEVAEGPRRVVPVKNTNQFTGKAGKAALVAANKIASAAFGGLDPGKPQGGTFITLNTQKRDRRSIEELHRDGEDRKRGKPDKSGDGNGGED